MTRLHALYLSKARQEYKIFRMKKDFPDMPEGVLPLQKVLAETDTAIRAMMQNSNTLKPNLQEIKEIYRAEAQRQRRIAYESAEARCDNCQLGVAFDKYGMAGIPEGKTLCGKLRLVHGKILEKKRTKLTLKDGKITGAASERLSEEEAAKLHEILHDFNLNCGNFYEPIGPESFAAKDAETRVSEINEWERAVLKLLGF
ncbi:hypothetical protein KY338_03385 [Candidatus Woesearchaeota archaeon]|nr:hypothetical protein [Candidatus Woesearchaeota archaeon]MBW3005354.1 hypothetical protein [Candidatus Woesearchaeota archaeon]